MSFRSRGGGFSGDRGGRGGFQSRGGARGGGYQQQSYGPPATVLEMGTFLHACEGEMLYSSTNAKIPYFNAPVYLENKSPVGKVDEILGPLNSVYFTVKPQAGIVATSFKAGDRIFIGGDKLLPLEKFLPKPKPPPGTPKPKRAGGGRGAPRGASRGFSRGGPSRGFSRGAPRGRGGFGDRGRGGSRGFSSAGRGAPRGASRGFGRGRGSY